MNKLAIFGCGGHGQVSISIARSIGWSQISLFDDNYHNINNVDGNNLVGDFECLKKDINTYGAVFVAIGNNFKRRILIEELSKIRANLISLIHESSQLAEDISIGANCIIMPNSTINTGTAISDGAIINSGSIIEHHCTIGKFTHIAPNSTICGNVSIGDNSWVGAASVVIENINIESGVFIGAGSVVINNVNKNERIAGNPARKI